MSKTTRKRKSKSRVTYGFNLEFPSAPFTMRDLRKSKGYQVSYITLYKRLEKALKAGILHITGEKPTGGRGVRRLCMPVSWHQTS